MKDKIENILKEANVPFEFIPLPDDLLGDVASHMKFYGDAMNHALATMIYKTEKGFIAVSRRGDTKVNSKKLREALGIKRLSLATEEEMKSLGLTPGLVPPLGYDIPVYLDKKLTEVDYFYDGTGHKLFGLKMKIGDLMKVNGEKVVDVTSVENSVANKRILSGITPSGNALHIGNYFGAVGPQIELQNRDFEVYYFVADLHALTTVQDKKQLEENIINVVLDYLALGLDQDKCIFFRQSQVPEHSQLAVVLANYISYGQMQRMHAFKDKLQEGTDEGSINMGLFNYPILMAADILLYKPFGVPVGEDQRQHIELTRDIAEKFNKNYKKEIFPLPRPLISKETGKILGTDGVRKMSKSLGNIIGIFDDEEVIKKQIMRAYTDPNRKHSTDPGKIEGNTVFMYHDLINKDKEMVSKLKTRYIAGDVGDVEVKDRLFEAHKAFFADARKKRKELENNLNEVKKILDNGSEKAGILAKETMKEVYEAVGISNKLNK